MSTMNNKLKIYVTAVVFVFGVCGLQAGGHHGGSRDIDRALLITDIVLRALIPTQTVIVEPPPVVTYTTPVYQAPTIVTTPETVITPVYSYPVYIAPTIHYMHRGHYDHYRPGPRWYSPPRHYRQPNRVHHGGGNNNHRRR